MAGNSETEFHASLGELVVTWNFAEGWIRTLLVHLGGNSQMAHILTSELGSVGLENALSAAATHSLEADAADRVKHLISLYSILRGYRNYWVHSTIFVAGSQNNVRGYTYSVSAKGKLQTHSQVVEGSNVKAITELCYYLGLFARGVTMNLRQEIDPKDGEIPPLPDKLPLPPEVDKSAPYPQWQKQPKPQAQGKARKRGKAST